MNDKAHMESREAYFERYRRLKEKASEISSEIRAIREEYDTKLHAAQNAAMKTSRDLDKMRRTITSMIDNGWDPTEASLRSDEDDPFSNTLWGEGKEPGISISPGFSINSISLVDSDSNYGYSEPGYGAVGAMGAVLGAAGANGSAGVGTQSPLSKITATGYGWQAEEDVDHSKLY